MNIVIIDCFDTWEHRVDLLYQVLTEDGHNVKILMSDFRHIEKTRRMEKKEDTIFFTAEPYKKNMSVARLHSHRQLSFDIFSWIESKVDSIDLLWVLAPPNTFIADAGKVKQHHPQLKLIIDLIDLWPETMPVGKMKSFLSPWQRIRDDNLEYADMIVTECNLYRDVLGQRLENTNVQTLYLARENKGYVQKLNLQTERIVLCYLGSINNIIGINTIGNVIGSCRKIKPVILHIIGDGEKREQLIHTAIQAGANVVDHGRVYDRVKKQQIFDSCHYGLNIMKHSVCVGLTMKSIDYFEFGLPIINNIHGDTWNAIEKYGCGVNVRQGNMVNFRNEKVFINIEEYNNMRLKSRKFYEKNLTVEKFRICVLQIINRLAG